MNKLKIITISSLTILFFSGCKKDFLDTPPKDKLDANIFFNTATDLEVYTNGFYEMLPTTTVYDAAYGESSDDIVPLITPDRVKGTRQVPVGRGSGGWSWSNLRTINFFLQNYNKCTDEDAKLKYGGIARFFRAYFYYDKVKTFGDVPWYSKVLEAGDEDLYKARDSRKLVMDSVLADIDYAVQNIPREVQLNRITKYTALALKARICLFEGTFRKYHNLGDHEKFLNEAVSATEELMNLGAYKLFTTGGINASYRELFARNEQTPVETILARDYNRDLVRHGLAYLMTSPTAGSFGISKDVINSYLMKDGSRFTDIPGYETMEFYDEMQNRDPRLQQTTAGPNFTVYGTTVSEPVILNATTTGYRVIKALPDRSQWGSSSSYNDIILFRYAETLLIYAEAKAELGSLTQDDLDLSVNKIRDRVGMPHLDLVAANASPDPYLSAMYPNVNSGANKGVTLEIRRERRLELFNEGFRWDDLMRWKEGKKVEQPMVGIYFSKLGAFDFNNDGKADVYVHDGNTSGAPAGISSFINVKQRPLTNGTSGNLNPFRITVTFDESRDYYYPIPMEDLTLNKNLVQNPNW
jgi:starch-binding outer membrane protein, SusD/RagB family